MRRVLIIAYYFPPIAGIGSLRLGRFSELLPEFGWEAEVVAPAATPHPSDPDLSVTGVRVTRSRSIELSQIGRRVVDLVGRATPGGPGSVTAPVRDVAHGNLFFPDVQVGWYPAATLAGLRRLRHTHFDAIYSSSFPITAHLVARTLAARSGVPWLAEFRDPWSDAMPVHSRRRARASRFEQAVASKASLLAMPTPTWAAHFAARWNAEIRVIPNGFDAATVPAARPSRPTIAHLGSFYPGRQSLEPLWRALGHWNETDPAGVPSVRFVGRPPAEVRDELDARGLGRLVEETGTLPHREALAAIGSASVLIAATGVRDDPIDAGWIPAKLFEYLATGLPIVLVGREDSDAARLLSSHPGCWIVEPDDFDAAPAALRAALASGEHERDLSSLTRRASAERLSAALDEVAGRSPRGVTQ